MAKHKVEITGVNTSMIKVLKSEEMTDLFIRYKNGDIKAREDLVNGNLKLVLSILKNSIIELITWMIFSNRLYWFNQGIDNFDLSQ